MVNMEKKVDVISMDQYRGHMEHSAIEARIKNMFWNQKYE